MKTLMMMVAALALSASAETITWSGGDTGSLSDATWTTPGGDTRAPQSGDRLVVPTGKTVTAMVSDGTLLASLTGADLSGTFVLDGFSSADYELPATFTLSGAGAFKILNCAKSVNVRGDNSSFSGPFVVSNAMFGAYHQKALGIGPVSAYRGSLNQNQNFFRVAKAGTYANALFIDSGNGYNAFESWGGDVIWSGPITLTAKSAGYCPRFVAGEGSSLTLTGGMTSLCGFVDFNGNVLLSGEGVSYGAAEYIFCDNNNGGKLRIGATVASGTKWVRAALGIAFAKANVLNSVGLKLGKSGSFDFAGYDQTAGDLECENAGSPILTSESGAATLTVTGKATGGSLGAALKGHLSLKLDNSATTLTLTNGAGNASTTDGSLIAKAGNLRLGATACFAALESLQAAGGTIGVNAGAKVNSDVKLAVTGSGTIDLSSGASLKVSALTLDGTPLAAGTYTSTEPKGLANHITGSGELIVSAGGGDVETLVWQGGNGNLFDANWKAAGETDAHVPYTGCLLSIPSGCTVTASGSDGAALLRFKGLELNGTFKCNAFTAGCTLGSAFALSGSGAFNVESCAGQFRLAADNSAFTGSFSFLKTKVYVDHVRALGVENEVTVSYGNTNPGGAYFFITVGGEYKNPLKIDGGSGWYACSVHNASQVVWSGPVQCMNTTDSPCPRFQAQDGARIKFTGGLQGAPGATQGRCDFNGDVILAGEGVTYTMPDYLLCDTGTLTVSAAVDPDTYLYSQATIAFGKANVVSGVCLTTSGSGKFDLSGYDQTTDEVKNAASGNQSFTSVRAPATLTVNGSAVGGSLGAALNGHLSFAFDNAVGALTLTNGAGNASTTDGKLIAKAGTLRLGSTANLANLSGLEVQGGTLAVDAGAKVNLGSRLEFTQANAGVIDLGNGVSLKVDTLVLNGQFLPRGTYSLSQPGGLAGHITGAGELLVANSSGEITDPNVFHWVGGHGTSLATAENWRENAAPTLRGSDVLVFTGGTSGAVVEGAIDVYGLVFDGSSDFTLGAGAGALVRLGAGCFALTNQTLAGTATFTIAAPVETQSSRQKWTIGANTALSLPATLSASPYVNDTIVPVTVSGTGTLDLGGDNEAFKPKFEFTTLGLVPVIRHSHALGSPERTIDVRYVPNAKVALTNDVPFNVYDSSYTPNERIILNPSKGYFVQRGLITFMTNGRTGYLSLYGGSIEGGVAVGPDNKSGDAWFQSYAGCNFRLAGKPVNLPGTLTLDNAGTFSISSTGNKWGGLRVNKTVLTCEVDDALCEIGALLFCMSGQSAIQSADYGCRLYGAVNLAGHGQTVLRMTNAWDIANDSNPAFADCRAIVDSATPAAITVTGAQDGNNLRTEFRRAAGLTMAGTGTLRFTKWISPTCGRLEVRSGELAFAAGGGWGGGTNTAAVAVTGGTLSVAADAAETAFGGSRTRTALSVSGSGTIDIADGCAVEVGTFEVDGEGVVCGTYGGANSPATADKRYAAKFGTGTGVLKVLRPRGFMVIVR